MFMLVTDHCHCVHMLLYTREREEEKRSRGMEDLMRNLQTGAAAAALRQELEQSKHSMQSSTTVLHSSMRHWYSAGHSST
jgi:hypothetical protein